MQSLSSKRYGNQIPEELPTSWEPLSRADASVFCSILRGNKHTNQPWTSLYTPATHKRTKSLKSQQQTFYLFLSHKTLCTWWFLYTRIVNFETHNEAMFHSVCVLHVKLRARLFVLLRMSCVRGQSRHETRKRDVVSVHGWVGSQPMRNRFLLTQLSVWTMFAGILLRKALEAWRVFTANRSNFLG